jgi:hypothetical protein
MQCTGAITVQISSHVVGTQPLFMSLMVFSNRLAFRMRIADA